MSEDIKKQEDKVKEDKIREEERKREDEKKRDEERQREEQLRRERQRQQETSMRDTEIHESTARTLHEKSKIKQEEHSKNKGAVYIDGNAIVSDYYRNINAARRVDPVQPEHAAVKESPAITRYKAHEKALSKKVQEYVSRDAKMLSKAKIQGQGRTR